MHIYFQFLCLSNECVQFRGPVRTFRNKLFFLTARSFSRPSPNPEAGGLPNVGCPRQLIQYIRSYPSCLEAVSSIRNPRTRHTVVTGTHITWLQLIHSAFYWLCINAYMQTASATQQLQELKNSDKLYYDGIGIFCKCIATILRTSLGVFFYYRCRSTVAKLREQI
jgi:hypothetical protein